MVAWLTEKDQHTVLYITDQSDSTLVVEHLFRQKGCAILVERDLNQAVKTAHIIDPAIIILDLNLLRSDWATLIFELSIATHAQILCVIPRVNSWDILALYEAGAKECLLRPASPLLLLMKATALMLHNEWAEKPAPYVESSFV